MEAPQAYKNAGIANLISGFLSVSANGLMFLSLVWVCIGVIWLVPLAAGFYQCYVGYQMFQGQVTPAAKNGTIAGIVAGVCAFNIFSIGGSAFAFMQLGDDEVAGWLEQNGVG